MAEKRGLHAIGDVCFPCGTAVQLREHASIILCPRIDFQHLVESTIPCGLVIENNDGYLQRRSVSRLEIHKSVEQHTCQQFSFLHFIT